MMTTCAEGHENPEGAVFCNTCGARLTDEPAPINAGAATPVGTARDAGPVPEAKRGFRAQPRWLLGAIIAAAAVVAVAVAVTLGVSLSNASAAAHKKAEQKAAAAARLKLLPKAATSCDLPADVIGDNGRSAFLDGEGDDFGSGELSVTDLACMLDALKAPDAVIDHMDSTRSIDGTQTDDWGDFSASWTYHPDNGLDIIIRLTDE